MENLAALPVWNRSQSLANADHDPEFWQELLTIWDSQRSQLASELRYALDSRDLKAAAMAAHTLKGSFTVLAAERAQEVARSLEMTLHAGREPLAQETALLWEEMNRLQEELISRADDLGRLLATGIAEVRA